MARDPRYDILFEPVKIGPVTAKKRFYQVPHCNGMGYRDPSAHATMRGIKAEGGWAVVCTEQVEIHHTSEITPFIELRLWDDRDVPTLARTVDAIHAHDALAGIELCYNGMNGPNFYTREVPMGPSHLPIATFSNDPVQARAMDKKDISNLRRWHRNAALRAKKAGSDIIYVYAAHGLGALHHFLSRRYNHRTDEYGGSLENRIRLVRELIEDTKAAVGDSCAVAVRITLDELIGKQGLHKDEVHDMIGHLAELPDLWDVVLGGWENDSQTSRFAEEAFQEPFVTGIKQLTSKPVVGVGRFTSPDAMVQQIKRGVLDLIGAARPSIADPFLPKKIEEGRVDDIRECIGCNICVASDFTMSPIRCTQNPTMGEEWRRGWHPERIAPRRSDAKVLVVGAGPAGLECARALGQRGYEVTLVTPAADVSNWTHNTMEQHRIQRRILEPDVTIRPHTVVTALRNGSVDTACVFTGRQTELPCDAVVLVTACLPNETLYLDLVARREEWADAGILSVKAVGDACAPATIAAAVYAGRRYAEELDGPNIGDALPFKREIAESLPPERPCE